jgi:very-short-patch-repair endonuclease
MPVFRRQHPIGPYVLDIYCAEARLAVEIDGMRHDLGDRPRRDARRDEWLNECGITTIRITAGDWATSVDEVVDAIVRRAAAAIEASATSTALPRDPPPPLRG